MNKLAMLIIGTLGGFAAGILLAPKSGKETREELKQKAQNIKSASADSLERVGEEAKEGGRRLKELADDSVANLKTNAREAKEEVGRRGEVLKEEASRVKNVAKRNIRQ